MTVREFIQMINSDNTIVNIQDITDYGYITAVDSWDIFIDNKTGEKILSANKQNYYDRTIKEIKTEINNGEPEVIALLN